MSKSYSWEEMPMEQEVTQPVVGINAQIQEIILRERLEREKSRVEAKAIETESVDNYLLINEPAITKQVTVTKQATLTPEGTVTSPVMVKTVTSPVTVIKEVIDDSYVKIKNNWMKFDKDIFKVLSLFSGPDFKVYIYMISQSYGAYDPKNICTVTHSMIMKAVGVNASPPISRSLKSLIQKGFLKRQFKADAKGELSIYRVFLPGEVVGIDGETEIQTVTK
jgi:hypothetical protein